MIFGHRRLTSRAHFLHPHRRSVAIIINPPPPWSYYRVPHWFSRTTRITLFSYIGIYVKLQENGILFLSGAGWSWTRYNNKIAQQKYDNNSHSNCIFAQCVRLSKFTASTVRTYDKYLSSGRRQRPPPTFLYFTSRAISLSIYVLDYRVKSTLKYTCFHRDRRRGYSVYKRVAGWLAGCLAGFGLPLKARLDLHCSSDWHWLKFQRTAWRWKSAPIHTITTTSTVLLLLLLRRLLLASQSASPLNDEEPTTIHSADAGGRNGQRVRFWFLTRAKSKTTTTTTVFFIDCGTLFLVSLFLFAICTSFYIVIRKKKDVERWHGMAQVEHRITFYYYNYQQDRLMNDGRSF